MPFSTHPSFRFSGAGATHVGCVRERNEDAILIDPDGELWAVADGMGGHGHGDVAASMVIDALALADPAGDPQESLLALLEKSNAAIYNRARESGNTMGATVVATFLADTVAYLAWIGDSRIYLWRSGNLRRLSKDHSQVQELIDQGLLTEDAARNHPERNVVTRAIGVSARAEIDLAVLPLQAEDRILLCSDGLTGCVSDDAIAVEMGRDQSDDAAVTALLRAALDLGAPDNVSVIVITVSAG